MNEEALLSKRFRELADKADRSNIYTFTNFLTPMEYSILLQSAKEFPQVSFTAFGGTEDAERVMVRFGDPESFGYETPFPIVLLEIKPASPKFAESLGHRDILGALMHLGIERDRLGDLWVEDNTGYVFCVESMASFIEEELCRVRHTVVVCHRIEALPAAFSQKTEEVKILASSERIDGVIAKVYGLSRTEVVALFREHKIFVQSALEENNSRMLKAGDIVSVRGYGKFTYAGLQSVSKKGKLNLVVEKRK